MGETNPFGKKQIYRPHRDILEAPGLHFGACHSAWNRAVCYEPDGALNTFDSGLGSDDLIGYITIPLPVGIAGGFRRLGGSGGGLLVVRSAPLSDSELLDISGEPGSGGAAW